MCPSKLADYLGSTLGVGQVGYVQVGLVQQEMEARAKRETAKLAAIKVNGQAYHHHPKWDNNLSSGRRQSWPR